MKYNNKTQSGFTLLEVLMVVAMLAIVGGAIITNYSGLDQKAATSTGVHSLSGINNAITVFSSLFIGYYKIIELFKRKNNLLTSTNTLSSIQIS